MPCDEHLEEARAPLSQEEIRAARSIGFFTKTCASCGRPTLYKSVEIPKTCGRLSCGKEMGEPWAQERGVPI